MVNGAAGAGWAGLWSVMFTTERAVAGLILVTSFADVLDLIWLGEELREACGDLSARHATTVLSASALDLGPIIALQDVADARAVVAELLASVIRRADELTVDASAQADRLWLSGLTASLFAARTHLTGAGAR
ncbi:hypothetical protein GALL_291940 [mine drainage metagenome]|uniref:Uncharacterized protein n=1 Tax=mine drainage metagenome TaxID=410659 RepID=A0A1J5R9X2_9ZZZZ